MDGPATMEKVAKLSIYPIKKLLEQERTPRSTRWCSNLRKSMAVPK